MANNKAIVCLVSIQAHNGHSTNENGASPEKNQSEYKTENWQPNDDTTTTRYMLEKQTSYLLLCQLYFLLLQ